MLPSNPVSAFTFVTGLEKNFEAKVAGQALVSDNLGSRLGAVREDALYASVLFLFLGLPRVALAVALTFAVTSSGTTRRRTEQALLRVRGATTCKILSLSAAEAALAAAGGTVLGMAGVLLPGFAFLSVGATTAVSPTLLFVGFVGLFLGFVAFLLSMSWELLRTTPNAARRSVARNGYAAVAALIAGCSAARRRRDFLLAVGEHRIPIRRLHRLIAVAIAFANRPWQHNAANRNNDEKSVIALAITIALALSGASFAKAVTSTIKSVGKSGDSITLSDGKKLTLPEGIEAETLNVG